MMSDETHITDARKDGTTASLGGKVSNWIQLNWLWLILLILVMGSAAYFTWVLLRPLPLPPPPYP